jgi:hypothetical protein
MPSTLPSPSFGTAAHAAPDGPAAIDSDVIGSEVIGSVGGSVVADAIPAEHTSAAAASNEPALRRRRVVRIISFSLVSGRQVDGARAQLAAALTPTLFGAVATPDGRGPDR